MHLPGREIPIVVFFKSEMDWYFVFVPVITALRVRIRRNTTIASLNGRMYLHTN